MKTANTPGRKNSRRIMALENLLTRPENKYNVEQIRILNTRIVSDGQARATRTKKQRGTR